MKFTDVFIKGLKIIEPAIYNDGRGAFFESYNQEKFVNAGIADNFIQDNQSLSQKGVLRGLHFQTGKYSQAKLVRVIKGSVIDVAVDLRANSETYGKHFSIELNETNNLMFYIPVGFAHGFIALDDQGREIFTFGKHKGALVEEVFDKEPGYFGWIQGAEFPLYTKKVLTGIKLRKLNTKL
jgi:dTDP-4-dehydrorhamnose 3,5-epimerase